jgi:hypothetical protein
MQFFLSNRKVLPWLTFLSALLFASRPVFSQATLLLEQPYGMYGTLNPTGHAAIYLERVCADSPVHLRMCGPGENGVVISRYKGIAGYDWIAIPIIPYLYGFDDPSRVPKRIDQQTVENIRNNYREAHLGDLGPSLKPGDFFNAGWTELVGNAYDRRIYGFRFATTREKDEQLVALLNARPNRSHFNVLSNNCADFDRLVLNNYFPDQFHRTIFPDAGITTPKRVSYALVKYGGRHPEIQLTVVEIAQIPGYRRPSHAIHGVAETLLVNGYVLPIVVLNPYIAGGLFADYLVRGSYRVVPKHPVQVTPANLEALLGPLPKPSTLTQAHSTADNPVVPSTSSTPAMNAPASAILDLSPDPEHP